MSTVTAELWLNKPSKIPRNRHYFEVNIRMDALKYVKMYKVWLKNQKVMTEDCKQKCELHALQTLTSTVSTTNSGLSVSAFSRTPNWPSVPWVRAICAGSIIIILFFHLDFFLEMSCPLHLTRATMTNHKQNKVVLREIQSTKDNHRRTRW